MYSSHKHMKSRTYVDPWSLWKISLLVHVHVAYEDGKCQAKSSKDQCTYGDVHAHASDAKSILEVDAYDMYKVHRQQCYPTIHLALATTSVWWEIQDFKRLIVHIAGRTCTSYKANTINIMSLDHIVS